LKSILIKHGSKKKLDKIFKIYVVVVEAVVVVVVVEVAIVGENVVVGVTTPVEKVVVGVTTPVEKVVVGVTAPVEKVVVGVVIDIVVVGKPLGIIPERRPEDIVRVTSVVFLSQHAWLPGTYVQAMHVGKFEQPLQQRSTDGTKSG